MFVLPAFRHHFIRRKCQVVAGAHQFRVGPTTASLVAFKITTAHPPGRLLSYEKGTTLIGAS